MVHIVTSINLKKKYYINIGETLTSFTIEYKKGNFEYGTLTLVKGGWWNEAELFRLNGVIDVKNAVYNTESKELDLVFTITPLIGRSSHKEKMRNYKISCLEELLKEVEEKRPGMGR